MGFEAMAHDEVAPLSPPAGAASASSPQVVPLEKRRGKPGRPPLNAEQRQAKIERDKLRRISAKLARSENEEQLRERVLALARERGWSSSEPKAAAPKAEAEGPAARVESEKARVAQTANAVAEMVGMVAGIAEGTRFALSEKKAQMLVISTTPWAASQETLELSPRAKGALAIVGLAAWLAPPMVELAKEYGPKVSAWFREQKQKKNSPAQSESVASTMTVDA